ncbi:MAG: SRPBCC domain-containing protein [Pseudomonadota bacterium]
MNAPVTEMKDPTALMIRRTFDADRAVLWKALTDPKAWMQWMGAKMATPQRCEADLRVGGAWLIEMRGNETGNEHNVKGEFVEIDEPNRVCFTWAWYSTPDAVSLVTYALSDAGGGKTTLTLTHERFASVEARDGHAMGWNASLDSLETTLAA